MRILIYGAGVIGSLYAALFAKTGYDVSIYARGKRLEALQTKGLLYLENKSIRKANVSICSKLADNDLYDFIFLTVRENQLYQALGELKTNKSRCIVTMVNSVDDYSKWEQICGRGRILPAFPGAGGSIDRDILDGALTPVLIQPTTFGEISGIKTKRTRKFAEILKKACIPYREVKSMHIWQLCHLAMVVPIADAYYEAVNPGKVGDEKNTMLKTAKRLKRNFYFLKIEVGELSPGKMNIFRFIPLNVLAFVLKIIFNSRFGDKFMYRHAMKAQDEMKQLHKQFYTYLRRRKNGII